MIRRLDPDKDIELYRQCWEWREKYPRSLRDATAVYSVATFEDYLEQARGPRASIGIFEGGMVGVVTLEWKAEGVYEVHISAKRGARADSFIEPCLNIQKTLFEDLSARMIFAFTPEWNKGAIRLAATMGLRLDGVRKISGATNARVIVWRRMTLTREDYERNIQNETGTDGDGAVFAERIEHTNVDTGREHSRHRAA